MSPEHNRWQLADISVPFREERFPAGAEGTGRLVRVTAVSASRAFFSERRTLAGASLGLPFLTRLEGEARLEGERLRITVQSSFFSVLLVGLLSCVLILAGAHVFLGRPGLGTGLSGGALVATGSWLLRQIPKVGRDVAADAVHVLALMAREERASGR